jgi:hypothetical protein
MSLYNLKAIAPVPNSKEFIDIMLSKTQRKTPTVVHKGCVAALKGLWMNDTTATATTKKKKKKKKKAIPEKKKKKKCGRSRPWLSIEFRRCGCVEFLKKKKIDMCMQMWNVDACGSGLFGGGASQVFLIILWCGCEDVPASSRCVFFSRFLCVCPRPPRAYNCYFIRDLRCVILRTFFRIRTRVRLLLLVIRKPCFVFFVFVFRPRLLVLFFLIEFSANTDNAHFFFFPQLLDPAHPVLLHAEDQVHRDELFRAAEPDPDRVPADRRPASVLRGPVLCAVSARVANDKRSCFYPYKPVHFHTFSMRAPF